MEEVTLTDVVLSAEAATKLLSGGWRHFLDARTEEWVFDRSVWIDPDAQDLFEWRDKRLPEAMIRIVTDRIFHFRSMDFCWRDREHIPERSPLGEILAQYVMSLIDDVGYLSYERDIPKRTIRDYPRVMDYISRRCEETYHVPVPDDVSILVSPKDLWSTWGFARGIEALYSPSHRFVVIPDKDWRSAKWRDSVIVHEVTHRIQHVKGWLIAPGDVGLSEADLQTIGRMFSMGKSLEEVAAECRASVATIKRVKGLIDERAEYMTKYYDLPTEVMAFGEAYSFLRGTGLEVDTIFDAIIAYMEEKGSYPASRDKDRLLGMIAQSSERIDHAIAELEGLAADGDPAEDRTDPQPAARALEPRRSAP